MLSHHQREWTKWFRELEDLELVKIPKCLKHPSPKVEELSVHTFSDASENPYAAVVYAHHVYEGESITAQLIMSKSRLASLKAVSIPRLELLGALEDKTSLLCNEDTYKWSDLFGGHYERGVLDPRSEQRVL